MNSDLYDSAAWRSFYMLNAEEAATFDEAMLKDPVLQRAFLEMNRLCAAIAATTAAPIEPTAGQLARLQVRLRMQPAHHPLFWLATTGWTTATVLALLLTLHLTGTIDHLMPPGGATDAPPPSTHPGDPPPTATTATHQEPDGKTRAKVETKRLHQEIEVLRANLANFQHRDRALFEVVPGVAVPIVMAMNPPDVALDDSALAKNDEHSPLPSLLGDALRALTTTEAEVTPTNPPPASRPTQPAAIPLYDAARDAGTLVLSNLPPADDGLVYNLWVTTEAGPHPIYVGTLPADNAAGTTTFDFSLGSTMVLPSGFLLTKDPQDAPATPTATNTILQGPPTPSH